MGARARHRRRDRQPHGRGWADPRRWVRVAHAAVGGDHRRPARAEVVLADGRAVMASERENADLFRALRGAGASFGIVTRFKSHAFDQGRVWAGSLVFPADQIPDVVAAVNRILTASRGESVVMLALAYAPPPDVAPVVMALAFHDGPETAGRAAFALLLDLDPPGRPGPRDGLPGRQQPGQPHASTRRPLPVRYGQRDLPHR